MAPSYNWLVDEDEILWTNDSVTESDEQKTAATAAISGGPMVQVKNSAHDFQRYLMECSSA